MPLYEIKNVTYYCYFRKKNCTSEVNENDEFRCMCTYDYLSVLV